MTGATAVRLMRLARGASVVVALVAVALPGASAVSAQDREGVATGNDAVADIAARVQAITGGAPVDCGRFFPSPPVHVTADQLEGAVQCGRDAASQRSSFWLLVGGRGLDAWIAQGLLAGPDGVIRRFYYDSAPSGGPGSTPSFELARCWLPGVHTYAGERVDLECANDVWKLVVNLVTLLVSGVALLIGVPLARRGLPQTAAAMMLVAGGIVAVITFSLAYVGAARWITAVPAVLCVIVLLLMSRWAFRRSPAAASRPVG
ncbi:MAG: hypothetical protein IT181_04460 [Acidobacteria bacterium]|nr:hypothetical protein [Acidobacteriota bacterium]